MVANGRKNTWYDGPCTMEHAITLGGSKVPAPTGYERCLVKNGPTCDGDIFWNFSKYRWQYVTPYKLYIWPDITSFDILYRKKTVANQVTIE